MKRGDWRNMIEALVTMGLSCLLIGCHAQGKVQEKEEVFVPMQDGVTIRTLIWKPSDQGPWPVVLHKGYVAGKSHGDMFLNAGYAYVGQGSRPGKDPTGYSGSSRFFADLEDGYDTIEWIAKQPWCDGNVVMFGESYYGATQWLAASQKPQHLKAIVPNNINPDFWDRTYRCQGAMNLSMTAISRAFNYNISAPNRIIRALKEPAWLEAAYNYFSKKPAWLETAYKYLPLIDMDKVKGGRENTLWNEYVSHSTYDRYWAKIGMRDKYQNIRIPVYIMAGWWDYYSGGSLRYWQKLTDLRATPEIRVRIDNGSHSISHDDTREAIRWLDWVVKGIDNGIKDRPPISLYVLGINQWRYENEWPLAGTRFTNYYFHSPDGARIGTLDTAPPGDELPTHYDYDPNNPCPSIGGNANHRMLNVTLPCGAVLKPGQFDQRPNESRQDVLVFTTPVLTEDLEVIGPVIIKLYAASSASDTDFTAVLIDVLPDGTAMNVTEGIVRARFRESIWEAPELITPGKIYEYNLELLPCAIVFKKGHRIRIHLSSSRFPLWDRNQNTGREFGMDAEIQVAHQTIYHDARYPSHIILPIIR